MADVCKNDLDRLETILVGKIDTERALRDGKITEIKTLLVENDKRYSEKAKNQDDAVTKAFASAQQAIDKSEANQTKINDGTYVKLSDMNSLLAAKQSTTDYQSAHKVLVDNITRFDLSMKDKVDTPIYNLNNITVQKQLDELKTLVASQINLDQGRGKGLSMAWAWIIGGVTIVASIIALLLNAIRLFGEGR